MSVVSTKRPNILLVVIDCLRADHCSLHGYQRDTTPTLQRIADEGVVFRQAVSTACWSLPSHASIFSGLYPSKHGVHDEQQYMPTDVPLLASELKRVGYKTVGYCGNPWVNNATGLARGFEFYDELRSPGNGKRDLWTRGRRKLTRIITGKATRRADVTTQRASSAIRELAEGDDPYFMFVHYNEPHTPRHVPRPDAERYLSPYVWSDAKPLSRDVNGYIAGTVDWTSKDLDVFTALYDAAIRFVDDRVAVLIDILRHSGTLDNTLVVVTADHGENLGDHGLLGHKFCLYDSLIHIPLIMRFPLAFKGGEQVDDQVQSVDLAPTIYEVTGVRNPWPNDPGAGRSLLVKRAGRKTSFSEQYLPNLSVLTQKNPNFDTSKYDRRLRSARTADWKYIWASDGLHELYRLSTDPGESTNLIQEEPHVAMEMDTHLATWVDSVDPLAQPDTDVTFDPEVTERLRSLGYIP